MRKEIFITFTTGQQVKMSIEEAVILKDYLDRILSDDLTDSFEVEDLFKHMSDQEH